MDLNKGKADLNVEKEDFNKEKEDLNEEKEDFNKERGDLKKENGDLNKEKEDLNDKKGDFNNKKGDMMEENGTIKEVLQTKTKQDIHETNAAFTEEGGTIRTEPNLNQMHNYEVGHRFGRLDFNDMFSSLMNDNKHNSKNNKNFLLSDRTSTLSKGEWNVGHQVMKSGLYEQIFGVPFADRKEHQPVWREVLDWTFEDKIRNILSGTREDARYFADRVGVKRDENMTPRVR